MTLTLKSLSRVRLCHPMDCNLPGSSVHGIFQAIVLEWGGCYFLLQEIFPIQGSNPSLPPCRQTLYRLSHQGSLVDYRYSVVQQMPRAYSSCLTETVSEWVKSLSHVQLFATPWTVAYQAPPSMGFSRQEYWSGLPFPSPEDPPDPGIESRSPAFQADTLTSEPPRKPSCPLFTLRRPLLPAPGTYHSLILRIWLFY